MFSSQKKTSLIRASSLPGLMLLYSAYATVLVAAREGSFTPNPVRGTLSGVMLKSFKHASIIANRLRFVNPFEVYYAI